MTKTTFSEAIFHFDGREYSASGDVEFEMEKEDWGIGSYEYWGHTETHRDLVWAPQNASVTNLTIWDGDAEVKEPSKELEKAAEDILIEEVEEESVEKYEE